MFVALNEYRLGTCSNASVRGLVEVESSIASVTDGGGSVGIIGGTVGDAAQLGVTALELAYVLVAFVYRV